MLPIIQIIANGDTFIVHCQFSIVNFVISTANLNRKGMYNYGYKA